MKRIVFDNTLGQKEAIEQIKTGEGRVDLVTELSPIDTLRVAQSPFATVAKSRGSFTSVFGRLNMRKADSPWGDVRLRQALNYAINRPDLIRYGANGNGVTVPALLPVQSFGHDPKLLPYAFDPARARQLLREAGHPRGLSVTLIAPQSLEVQATVVGKMLEAVGFTVERQILGPVAYARKTLMSHLDEPATQQRWDIALTASYDYDWANTPLYSVYYWFALGGADAWVTEQPELRRLYEQSLRTVDRDRQQVLIRQMEQHTREQAYFLFLYNPIKLYAVNRAVAFVPYVTTVLNLAETSVTDQHWSVRKGGPKP